MNYNNPNFWLLFVAVYALYWRLRHRRQNDLLLVASYVFYGFWDYRFLFLILISTVIDFIGGLGVAGVALPRRQLARVFALLVTSALVLCTHVQYATLWQAITTSDGGLALAALPRHAGDFWVPLATAAGALAYGAILPRLYAAPEPVRRKTFLVISMVANLAILGVFKYCDFFLENFVDLLHLFGVQHVDVRMLSILLPPGISFYTFQAMSYTIDIYRGHATPTDDLRDFALFVCFFPHLVAGPIMRASTLLPQVVQPRQRKPGDVEEGFALVLIGLFKKIVIADNLAPLVNMIFFQYDGRHPLPTGPESLLGLYGFMFQVYGDFSGYSAVARGIAKWLGFELMINFQAPYFSTDPAEYWRRNHISLSSWFRDYCYIPLGGNRGGRFSGYRNILITMALAGLWHGAAWTYVMWGVYTGLLICIARAIGMTEAKNLPGKRLRFFLQMILCFNLVASEDLWFRSTSFSGALHMAGRIFTNFTPTPLAATMLGVLVFYTAPLLLLEAYTDGERHLDRLFTNPWPRQALAYAYFVLMLVLFPAGQAHEFIYFQF